MIVILPCPSDLGSQGGSALCPWEVFSVENLSTMHLLIILEGVTFMIGGFVVFIIKESRVTLKVHCIAMQLCTEQSK